MTATTIQTSAMTVRQPAISRAIVAAFVAVALAVTMLIAMVPGLTRVPATVDQPRGLDAPEAPVAALVEPAPSDGAPVVSTDVVPQPGPHPSR